LQIAEDAYVCSLVGELDAFTLGALQDEIADVGVRGGRRLIVDLIDVTFVDAGGVELLLRTAQGLRAIGGELVVVADCPRTLRTFELAQAEAGFHVERSLVEAVKDLAGRSYAEPSPSY
jgi:anti-anti-sigma factor